MHCYYSLSSLIHCLFSNLFKPLVGHWLLLYQMRTTFHMPDQLSDFQRNLYHPHSLLCQVLCHHQVIKRKYPSSVKNIHKEALLKVNKLLWGLFSLVKCVENLKRVVLGRKFRKETRITLNLMHLIRQFPIISKMYPWFHWFTLLYMSSMV